VRLIVQIAHAFRVMCKTWFSGDNAEFCQAPSCNNRISLRRSNRSV